MRWPASHIRGRRRPALRLAWRRGLTAGLAAHPEEVAPYKILPEAYDAVKAVVGARLRLFNFM